MNTNKAQFSSLAVVIGLCVHGLAVCRALSDSGVQVHALEKNNKLPGSKTNAAKVHFVASLSGESLIESLIELHRLISHPGKKIVLFLISDEMVRSIGEHWQKIKNFYQLSWENDIDLVLTLLNKENLAKAIHHSDLNYPRSEIINEKDDINKITFEKHRDYIVKPANPLSSFKVRKTNNKDAINRLLIKYSDSLPFIVQPWIGGGDDRIFFCALYYDNGHVVASFTGQKVMSYPPALGQTTAAIAVDKPEILKAAKNFFSAFKLSGPVSLEVKIDASGIMWVIEPTLGRTDFWVDCCVRNNVNLPYLEFLHQVKVLADDESQFRQKNKVIWLDSSKDPSILINLLKYSLSHSLAWKRPAFALFRFNDMDPFFSGFASLIKRKLKSLPGKKVELESKQ